MIRVSRRDAAMLVFAIGSVAGTAAGFRFGLRLTNPTTAALAFLLIVVVIAATSRLWVAIVTSVTADLWLNYFFMPPFGTFTIADPQNWVAMFVFLAVGVIASQLSAAVRDRERDAAARRDELARLFELSRDILATTDSTDAVEQLARLIARRFDLDYAAVCLPRGEEWEVYQAGMRRVAIENGGPSNERVVALRFGAKSIGRLTVAGRPLEPGALDALAGVAAIAVERAQFLGERRAAELAKQGAELKSALLASLGHDLRTPLTAIRVAASNLKGSWLQVRDREEQSEVILAEVERLSRLFQNILEMTRIDAGALASDVRWVHPAEIVEAARDQVEHALRQHRVEVESLADDLVHVDPRLTASALAHVLENAAQYTNPGSAITVTISLADEELMLRVRDRGPGISPEDIRHVFDRFYRGTEARRRASGTGMGLSIAAGLLAAEHGRIAVSNCADGGTEFTIVVPAQRRPAIAADQSS